MARRLGVPFRFDRCGAGICTGVLLLRPPGVYRVTHDTSLLVRVLRDGEHARGRRVLDIGSGTGALALEAARAGAAAVTAVDLSLRSITATWVNAVAHRAAIRVRRGDLFAPVRGERFDLVLANPPYVPAATTALPRHRIARCWDAGPDGRLFIDRICGGVRDVLTDGGTALIVHSEVCDENLTVSRFEDSGLRATVVARRLVPFGPVMRARTDLLQARGLHTRAEREEEIVVVEARRD